MKYYTGIGSRETPPYILDLMKRIARALDRRGDWVLRSGGAEGADSSFESGVLSNRKEIYLPWRGFNHNSSPYILESCKDKESILLQGKKVWEKRGRGNWDRMKMSIRLLMSRNVQQVCGLGGMDACARDRSRAVVCWTPRGDEVGGTAQALFLAHWLGVKVYNLGNDEHLKQLLKVL